MPTSPVWKKPGKVPVRRLTGVQVAATGSFAPDQVVTNDDLKRKYGFDPEWVVQRTGILERRIAPPDMVTSDMAREAGRRCLEQAGVSPKDIDLLIVGTFTGDSPLPSTSCRVQHALGLNCPAMDVQAACAGFIYGMISAMQYVAAGCAERVLVIGVELISRIINPKDPKTYPLFGDGAGAALITAGSERQGLIAYSLGADGSGADLIRQRMGGSRLPTTSERVTCGDHYLEMEGRQVFKWAIRVLDETIHDVCGAAGMTIGDISLFIAHQANLRIIEAAADGLGIPKEKVFTNLHRYGNTSAASIPLALDEAVSSGRVKRGDILLLSGFGAGLTWGTTLLRW